MGVFWTGDERVADGTQEDNALIKRLVRLIVLGCIAALLAMNISCAQYVSVTTTTYPDGRKVVTEARMPTWLETNTSTNVSSRTTLGADGQLVGKVIDSTAARDTASGFGSRPGSGYGGGYYPSQYGYGGGYYPSSYGYGGNVSGGTGYYSAQAYQPPMNSGGYRGGGYQSPRASPPIVNTGGSRSGGGDAGTTAYTPPTNRSP